jgi:outer membrane protein insertion porin family
VDVTDPNQVSLAIRDAAGTDNISLVNSTVTLDDLDNPLKPTSGYRLQTTGEVAGLGGDVHYGSVDAAAYYFMPLLFDGVVLKLKATGGTIMGWNNEQVPILDRFFKGGDSLRGFMRAGIGPRMERPNTDGATDSIGGETYGIGTVETIFPLGLPEEFGLEGTVFTDVGTLFGAPEKNELDPDCTNGVCNVFGKNPALRASVGAGLIWDSPFGPLELDVAWPVVKQSYDKTELVRFSVGTRF